jgi:eukaryotic-like serine/threonine-protein kinase
MDETREQLRRTLAAQGVGLDASVSETLDPEAARLRALFEAQPELGAPLPTLLDPDYQVVGQLGRGGMAMVYLAEQVSLAREVAIKRALDPGDVEASLLLLREAMITGQLEHPNIVPVHALIGDPEGPAVVMKRLSGHTWDELIQGADSSLERQLEIFVQVLNAVSFAHSRGVVHRDIKPSNVMIGDFGEVYLVDWGVSRRDSDPPSDAIVGTPRYMAPEMAEGHADARTDVFLLGATLHEVLTREPRHRGDSAIEVLYTAMNVEPFAYSDSVPEELASIANRACARDPAQRYQTAGALRDALATFREHRAANMLSDQAEAQLRTLCSLMEHTLGHDGASARSTLGARNAEVQDLFARTRFGFEAALRVWGESPSARDGLRDCLLTMVDYELTCRRPEPALALLSALQAPDTEREARAKALDAELTRERERLRAMELDRDPRVGAPDRVRAYRAMAVACLVLTSALFTQRLFFPGFKPSTKRLTLVGAFVLLVMSGIIWWWRRHGAWNFINRRIAEIAISTLAVSFASRLSGYILHTPAETVLVSDAFILGLGGAVLSAYHRAGPWLALVSFFVAVVGSIWPNAIDELFISLSVFLPLVFLLLKRVDRVDMSHASTETVGVRDGVRDGGELSRR